MNKRRLRVVSKRHKYRTGRGRLRAVPTQTPQTVVIDRRFRIRLPWNLPGWRVGRRVFWKARERAAVVSIRPKGMLTKGRYLSGRVQRMRSKLN